MARFAVPVVFVISVALGACAGRGGGGKTACPGAGWCGAPAEAARMAEPIAGETLDCPIHIEAEYATQGGGTLPAGIPAGAHGRLDERRSERAEKDGGGPTCCYDWVSLCPAG